MIVSTRGFLAVVVGCLIGFAADRQNWIALVVGCTLAVWLVLAKEVDL